MARSTFDYYSTREPGSLLGRTRSVGDASPRAFPGSGARASEDRYEAITLKNFETVPQLRRLPYELRRDIRVVGSVLPFKSNRYVVEELIDWDRIPEDPMFQLTFPQRAMLEPEHYARIAALIDAGASPRELKATADGIRYALNPHPAGQVDHNVPMLEGHPLPGMQHKYRETALFFPSQGQTCHAYCSYCFRWPQFVGLEGQKFAMKEAELLTRYVQQHPELTDILFTGGDPLVMRTSLLRSYIEPLLEPGVAPNLRTIRVGSKALAYWPQRFVTDDDADDLLRLFERVVASGRQLAYMAHFNHWAELEHPLATRALARVRETGAVVRTQTPIVRHVNADPGVLARMWQGQVQRGAVPYYLFVARDTGAHRYFELPLLDCWRVFRRAYQQLSGLARTVRGPVMSATPGKVQVLGAARAGGERVIALRFLQGRNPDWVGRPFFAKYDAEATWLDGLRPAFGEQEFFYEPELRELLSTPGSPWSRTSAQGRVVDA